jgi:DNA mismatch endonuclease (patch repair protein)
MQGNRRRDTRPELALRSELHRRGVRFRVELPIRVAGFRPIRADLAFTRWSVLVFVDGCFWHGCPRHGTAPRANADYWLAKIARNVARDERQTAALELAGWTVVRVWEHVPPAAAADIVVEALQVRRRP